MIKLTSTYLKTARGAIGSFAFTRTIRTVFFHIFFYSLVTILEIIQLPILNSNAPQNAPQNPLTSNPFTIDDANQNMSALITNVNNPSVRIFTGNVRMRINGRINAFTIPSTITVIIAEYQPPSLIPCTILEIRIKTPALSTNRRIKSIRDYM